jgi:hypothetical protein
MTPALSVALILTIVFVSTLTRATLGFGNALLAMPLLAIATGILTATPLVALQSQTIALLMLAGSWQSVNVRAAWRLVLASLLGIPIGLLLLKAAPEELVKAILGILLIVFGGYNLLKFRLPRLRWNGAAYLFGFGAGVLGGAYNTNGPPIIVYGMLSRWSPEQFRATLQGYFVTTGMLILVGHGLAGLWTARVLWIYLYSLPVLALAFVLGSWLARRIPAKRFDHVVYAVLVVMGVFLII